MKKVLVIAHFCSEFDGSGNNRFNYLVQRLANEEREIEIELVTSNFSHSNKTQRSVPVETDYPYKITMIQEPTYKKNISIKRFYSHYIMSRNLKKYLEKIDKPDVIYCAVPSLDVALVAAKYAKKKNIKYVIDIQDLWPDAYKLIFNIPILNNIFFYPMQRNARKIYKAADVIVAVSDTYLKHALQYNRNIKKQEVVFLGTDIELFDKLNITNKYQKKAEDEIWLVYIGTLGHSYDLTTAIHSLKLLKDRGINHIRMIVMGDGPLKEQFESLAIKNNVQVDFMGRLPYDKMIGVLGACDIAINPISKGAAQSIINKHGDYAAAGLPIINTQESKEYRELIEFYDMGINCNNNDPIDVSNKIYQLIQNPELLKKYKENSRKFAIEKFDRRKTYQKIIDIIKEDL